ncbi:hypothetical protein HY312_04105 [Candidatus Saccharibacteria bacterium]|nr:hypothetical protein [Candidatus Saccharibacteria bacterium]
MTPIQANQMPDLSDDFRQDIESSFPPKLVQEAQAVFRGQDTEVNTKAPRRIVSSENAEGEPISSRELHGTDHRYAIVAEARKAIEDVELRDSLAREQIKNAGIVKAYGQRVEVFRSRTAKG